jgi:hypothetical protein
LFTGGTLFFAKNFVGRQKYARARAYLKNGKESFLEKTLFHVLYQTSFDTCRSTPAFFIHRKQRNSLL